MAADDPATRVSVVVVNYNAGDLLTDCVASLRLEGVRQVIVVDNASVDGSIEALERADPDVTVVQTGANLGYGRGANRGAAFTDTELLLVLNPDTVVQPGMIKVLVEALDHNPRLGIVGPRIENPDGSLYPSAREFPRLIDSVGHGFLGMVAPRNRFTRRYRMLDWDHAAYAVVDWVSGSCMLVRRRAWDAIGGFDEDYFMYAEDVDLCWRVGRAGWQVAYEPAAVIMHVQGVSADRHPYRMIVEHHRALLRFAARSTRYPERALLPVVAVGLVARTGLAWAHRWLQGRAGRSS